MNLLHAALQTELQQHKEMVYVFKNLSESY
jgi:hypothetical protein